MDFLNDLGEKQRIGVEVIMVTDLDLEDKLTMLRDIGISGDIYEKIKNILSANEKKEQPAFLLIMDKKTSILAEMLLEQKNFKSIRKLVDTQSKECKESFEEFLKQREAKSVSSQEGKAACKAPEKTTIPDNNRENSNLKNLDSTEDELSDDETKNEETQWSPNITPEFFRRFPKCLNILVLGETGVGKSTFINGLANYLKYDNMHEAEKHGVQILIRSSFTHMDEDYNKLQIKSDPTIEVDEENENMGDGQSSTQSPKAYQFEWGPRENRKTIRIIDTPGVGDIRGPEQEKMNFAKILSFITDYPEIHAILILMKPNDARLTVTYRYCINELLTHLHVSASRNILFCFTNARITLYQPGDTLPALEAHLNDLYYSRQVRIPLDENTIFCFDNESFRFLCAWKQGAKFEDQDKENFNTSWITTVEETFRLFKRISELSPHKTEETLNINNIRSVILALSRPLGEIAKMQMINTQLIDEKLKEVSQLRKQGKSLSAAELYVDQVTLTAKEIDQPVTVCTNASCSEIVQISATQKETNYTKKCHSPCHLSGVKVGIVPNPQIQKCACFNGNIQKCKVCGCSWNGHLHIRHELVKTMRKITDPTVRDSIKNCEDGIKMTERFLDAEIKRKKILEDESKTISSHCAEFAAFLKKHSIIPYNDVYLEYVEHLIREEDGKIAQGGPIKTLLQLKRYRDEHAQQVKILETHHRAGATSAKSLSDIHKMLDELRQMKDCGALIREIEKLEMLSVRKECSNRVTNVDIKNGCMDKIYSSKHSNKNRENINKPGYKK